MPEFSIIVPIYNVEQFLPQCIDSILAQTFTDFELILVDDGSPDSCGAICDAYAVQDMRIRVIHEENSGVSVARNTGLNYAIGKYIAFCDSDDFWEPHLLQTVYKTVEETQADCVIYNFATVDYKEVVGVTAFAEGVFDFRDQSDIMDYLVNTLLCHKHGWELWNHIFCGDIIRTHHLRCCTTCNNYAEDLGFVIKYLLHAKRVCCIGECLYMYRVVPGSMMYRSRDVIRLNEMNEVSFDVGIEFNNTIREESLRKQFPVLHFLIMYNQYQKLVNNGMLEKLGEELSKIRRKKWWRENTKQLYFCHKALCSFWGKENGKRAILFSHYCLHRNWKRYCIERNVYHSKRIPNWMFKKILGETYYAKLKQVIKKG